MSVIISDIPVELQQHIISYLAPHYQGVIRFVCKLWSSLVLSDITIMKEAIKYYSSDGYLSCIIWAYHNGC